jgi:hypothetical protein
MTNADTGRDFAGYIVQDKQGNAIFGFGETVDEAWAMVVAEAGPFFDAYGEPKEADRAFTEDFKVRGATSDLLAQVREEGGAIAWRVIRGVACTRDQAEALGWGETT